MYNFAFALLLLLLTTCNTEKNLNEFSKVESPIIASDISSQKITAFAEDEHGHIWIGTFRGLNKYDGNDFYQYFSTDEPFDLPDNHITDILCDSKNRLWISTVNGVCLYTEKDNFQQIPINGANKNGFQLIETHDGRVLLNFHNMLAIYSPENNSFYEFLQYYDIDFSMKIFVDSSNDLWLIGERTTKRYNSITLELKDSLSTNFRVNASYLWKNNELWIAGENKIELFDTRTSRYLQTPSCVAEHPLLRKSTIEQIYSTNPNTLLFATDNGLFVYNRSEQTLFHQDESGFSFLRVESKVSTLFVDSQRNLWIGTKEQGFSVQFSEKKRFNNDNFLNEYFRNKSVIALVEDNERNLWLSTTMNGLFVYDLNTKKIHDLDIFLSLPQRRLNNNGKIKINSMFLDDEGAVWLASNESNWIGRCKYENGKLTILATFAVEGPSVFTQDNNGTIWVSSTSEYVYSLQKGDTEFESLQLFPPFYNFVSGFSMLSNGKIMAAPFFHRPKMIDPITRDIETINFDETEWQTSIPRSVLITNVLFEDSRGEVWIGTKANGVLRYFPDEERIEPLYGTSCLDIVSIEEDIHGNLWMGTEYGLSRFNREDSSFTNYYASAGIGGNQFNERASSLLSNGTLVFGGTHGLTFFDPADVSEKRSFPLLFENLKVHNVLVRPQEGCCIDKHLAYKPDIRLRHDQNGFSISFAALDYSEFKRINYHYKLEGFDNYWVDASNNREAYYANIPAGSYIFSVRITDNDQSITETQESIRVIIRPAPWLTWWAVTLYFVIIGIITYVIFRGWWRYSKEKEATLLAEREKENEHRINQMNMQFFTNVSHEFRTPLTMIVGPISQLYDSVNIPQNEKKLIGIIKRNAMRMLQMVNQMMDFHKLENDTLKLKVKRRDITEILYRILEVFQINAQSKDVEFRVQGLEAPFETWIDEDKLEKIMGNLLSNALKFTPSGGNIIVEFDVIGQKEAFHLFELNANLPTTQFAKLTVTDNGKGISKGDEEKIFERFFKSDDDENNYYGTGIGLYHARTLAQLHKGFLKAENREDCQGSIFTLLFPVNEGCYTENERIVEEKSETKSYFSKNIDTLFKEHPIKRKNQKSVMVIEDDWELSNYLYTILSPYYNVIYHFDANNAYQQMLEKAPDLILSDIVMPGKDGYSLCRDIKNNIQLSHIPVILVTAKTALSDQLKGLDIGADAYITKPFEPSYLLALIKSQLLNREKVQRLLSATTKTEEIEKDILSHHDNTFMTELYYLMETELSNPELNILQITERMKISRSKFYYKVKGLTGETPAAFFRIYKLNRAAELIREGKYNVSEIADMTGFATLSHFSASFKKQFGKSPSKYL